jgi:hypothetical protein
MVWLRSNDRFDTIANLDDSSGAYQVEKRSVENASSSTSFDGFFSLLSEQFVALYRAEGALHLRLADLRVSLAPDVIVEVSGDVQRRVLVVMRSGTEVARLQYALDPRSYFKDDPTPFLELEDLDFGLFISNVSKSPERQRVLLGEDQ